MIISTKFHKDWAKIVDFIIKQADGNNKISGRGLKIIRQRLKFDKYLVNVCETTIEQILFFANDKFYNQNCLNSCIYHWFVISIWSSKQRKTWFNGIIGFLRQNFAAAFSITIYGQSRMSSVFDRSAPWAVKYELWHLWPLYWIPRNPS